MSTPPSGIDTRVWPAGPAAVLSREEIARVSEAGDAALHALIRRCALAVLNTGNEEDDPRAVLSRHPAFDIEVRWRRGAMCVDLRDAPPSAFVDGVLIRGIQEHLFAVLRDLVYTHGAGRETGPTDHVFGLLRNAGVVRADAAADLVVCWGGHSISRGEYDYSKAVGYQLGLRGLNICTGCGPGAMKGPMKGAAVGHSKQRLEARRHLGLTEPGIIAAEPPNPIVNELAVLPDIEQRLEAFLRVGHAFVIFPGGVGTTEELLFLIGVKLHPDNAGQPLPLVLTGPPGSEEYFARLDDFIGTALGPQARACYEFVPGDPEAVAVRVGELRAQATAWRAEQGDPMYFNWRLTVPEGLQTPFVPNHASMAALDLRRSRPLHERVADLRRALSGIVAGNVKESGIQAVEALGPFELHGEPALIGPLDALLRGFVQEGRMRLPGAHYEPSYRLVA
jgi:pyrimidine/purine-5'-nucleotide nucleosidase